MKKFTFLLVASWSCFVAFLSSAHSQEVARLTLRDFLEKSISQGPALSESQAKVDFSIAREKLANSYSWPSGKVEYLFGASPEASGNALVGSTDYGRWGLSQGATVELAIPLYTFGAISGGQQAASKGTEAEKYLLAKDRLALRTQIAEIYYGYQLAFEFVDLAENVISKLEEARDKGKKTGKAKASDLDKLDVYIFDTKARLMEAEKSKELMRSAMTWKLGCFEKQCEVKWDTANLTERVSQKSWTETDKAKLKVESLALRPEIIAAQKNVEARRALVDSELGQLWPALFIGGQIQKTWTPIRENQLSPFAYDPLNDLRAVAGLGIRWNFNFMEKSSKLAMARAELIKAEAILRNAQEGLKADFDRVYGDKIYLKEALELRVKSSKLAKRIFLDSIIAFTLGSGSAKDILEALGAYGLAEKSRLETLFQHNTQDFKMAQVMGVDLVD